jgi:RecB family endonuclease NucS
MKHRGHVSAFFLFRSRLTFGKSSRIVYARPGRTVSVRESEHATPFHWCVVRRAVWHRQLCLPLFLRAEQLSELLSSLCPNVMGPSHRHFRWTGHRPTSE